MSTRKPVVKEVPKLFTGFMCEDYNQCIGKGETLEEALEDYMNIHDHESFEELTFYRVEEVKIKQQIVLVNDQSISE